ncbi:hypothetical protein A8L34_23690 [Bacillus sp. FJAT-27264]|uniref:hypothetical protein n=1 Tax=Paenibacillus sp. (strain DSM 101736 / FJAT-27264) TaxID=1850362 RepID=UPI000807F361|nr:hypothetical protein [Bacillus sp. FJAT-27264]OBZ08325.1 hypothetical protein A8L34_23690 [Bacillus sp. FJAT-27264]
MRKSKFNLILFITILVAAFIHPEYSYSATTGLSTEMFKNTNNIYRLDDANVLIKTNNELNWVDVTKGSVIKKVNSIRPILDVKLISSPQKIIVLTQTATNKVQKQVFNEQGVEISKSQYPITVTKDVKVKWAAPYNGMSERLMIQKGNQFSLYQSPWKQPLSVYDAQIKNSVYEYVNVTDWDYQNHPYLVIQYSGERTMATDFFVKIVDLNTKKSTELNNIGLNNNLRINDQHKLELWNSYTYSDIMPANATHPDPTQEQSFYSVFSLESGKALFQNKALFNQVFNKTSGWETQNVGGFVFVQDLENNLWSLYQPSGTLITSKQTGLDSGSKFLTYNTLNRTAYFLVTKEGAATPSVKGIQIK